MVLEHLSSPQAQTAMTMDALAAPQMLLSSLHSLSAQLYAHPKATNLLLLSPLCQEFAPHLVVSFCAGASIAIDDCYELWESGFISIPHNFQVKDLRPELRKLLSPSTTTPSTAAGSTQQGSSDFAANGSSSAGISEGNGVVPGAGKASGAASVGAEAAPSAAGRLAAVMCAPGHRRWQRLRGSVIERRRGVCRGILLRPHLRQTAFLRSASGWQQCL